MKRRHAIIVSLPLLLLFVLGVGFWSQSNAEVEEGGKILFIRGGSGTGGFFEGGSDGHLSDINDYSTNGGNHGWGMLADLLQDEGFELEQMIEGPAENNTPIDFASLDLSQYSVIVLGSNNADYSSAAVDAVETFVRAGGGLLVISDANWGRDWDDAPTSDQAFLDRFGLVMNQDLGTYRLDRSQGEFANTTHPIVDGVDAFDGEGVSPITIEETLPAGVTAEVIAPAEGTIRLNDTNGQGSTRQAMERDGALVVAQVDSGRVAGHFDRNTFFNTNGAGTDVTRFDNGQYAVNLFTWLAGSAPPSGIGVVSGNLVKWQPMMVSFTGPMATEADDEPNPFLDYRLQVLFTGPSGQQYDVPGYFAGDGNGNGTGDIWQVRFAADEAGQWTYAASFRSGEDVAVSLDPEAGTAASFDGDSGSFVIADLDPLAAGFMKWGRLEYVGQHYLKFQDGGYWLKGGTNSPENLLGYAGFDNTFDQPSGASTSGLVDGVHRYEPHVADWNDGDPNFVSADTGYDGKGLIGALNYLGEQNVNSIYFLPMNLGGDGRETYPFISPEGTDYDNTHYDISKLEQWNIVLAHAQEQGIAVNVVLAETESGNEQWLDGQTLTTQRKLFYRELIARYTYLLAVKWNLSEENDYSISNLRDFADYIQALDWQQHPISVHNHPDEFDDYEQIKGDSRFSATSIQYFPSRAGRYVEEWRTKSTDAGWTWVIDMDENTPGNTGLTDTNVDDLRKRVLYDVYFSGGNIEWYAGYHDLPLGGDLRLEDFRTREEMWNYMWYARRFMQENLPFWEMAPADDLLVDEAEDPDYKEGEVFAKLGEVYAIYLPDGSPSGSLDLTGVSGSFYQQWYNPRTGMFEGDVVEFMAGDEVALGEPPADVDEDWVVLIRSTAVPTPTPTVIVPTATPNGSTATPSGPTATPSGPTATPSAPTATPVGFGWPHVTELLLVNADSDEIMYRISDGDVLNLAALPTRNFSIEAKTNPFPVGSVVFVLNNGEIDRIENFAPYTLVGDGLGNYLPWTPSAGSYTLVVTAYSGPDATGTAGLPKTIQFTVIDELNAVTATPRPTSTPTPVFDEGIYLPSLIWGER